MGRIGQIGEDRGVKAVPLLQADLVQADVCHHPLRVDLLFVLQPATDDQRHHFRTDSQLPRDLLFGRADDRPQHQFLEAECDCHLLPLERRQQPLPVPAPVTAVIRWLIDEKPRLPPHIQIA
ncbi:MAG: hypothetical protein KDA79_07520, partial [Planctomycetaceae bacterium]|nr:hypothetical protein [Planctomycetaceae bacterium]